MAGRRARDGRDDIIHECGEMKGGVRKEMTVREGAGSCGVGGSEVRRERGRKQDAPWLFVSSVLWVGPVWQGPQAAAGEGPHCPSETRGGHYLLGRWDGG